MSGGFRSRYNRAGAGLCQELRRHFLEKRLYQIDPAFRPAPNPLGREYLLLIQQNARLHFSDALLALRNEADATHSLNRLYRFAATYLALKATTAMVDSLLVESALVKPEQGPPK